MMVSCLDLLIENNYQLVTLDPGRAREFTPELETTIKRVYT